MICATGRDPKSERIIAFHASSMNNFCFEQAINTLVLAKQFVQDGEFVARSKDR